MPDQESFADLGFPLRGVDQSRAFGAQQPGTTPLGVNVRGYEPASRRAKGGARPGLAKYLSAQLPNGAHLIQNLNIVDPTSDAALLSSLLDWSGLPSGGVQDTPIPSVPPPPSLPLSIPGFASPIQFDPSDPGWGTGHTVSVVVPRGPNNPGGPTTVTVPVNTDWGSAAVSDGVQSRAPSRVVPVGGTGAQPNKNRRNNARRTPNIIWGLPASILTGTALSSLQLNAVAQDPVTLGAVAGSFAYTPPVGTVLPSGSNQPLYAYFTPTNRTLYTYADSTNQISVGTFGYGVYWGYGTVTVPAGFTWALSVGGTPLISGSTAQGGGLLAWSVTTDPAFTVDTGWPPSNPAPSTFVNVSLALFPSGPGSFTVTVSAGGVGVAFLLRRFINTGSGWTPEPLTPIIPVTWSAGSQFTTAGSPFTGTFTIP